MQPIIFKTIMESLNHQFLFQKFKSSKELSELQQTLIQRAHEAALNAYAPYSKFRVGAALLLSNGEIIAGNNQENAAYPSGLCAERVTALYAKSQYPKEKILKMAITTASEHQKNVAPPFPCGSCRQVLIEYEFEDRQPIELILRGENDEGCIIRSVADILPFAFNGSYL